MRVNVQRSSLPCGPLLNITMSRERSPTSMGSDCSFDQSDVFGGKTTTEVSHSNWGSRVSSMCSPPLMYPNFYGSLPHLPEASSKATGKVMQRRDYRRNVLPESTPTDPARNGLPNDRGDNVFAPYTGPHRSRVEAEYDGNRQGKQVEDESKQLTFGPNEPVIGSGKRFVSAKNESATTWHRANMDR